MKSYKVTAPRAVNDVEPGGTLEAEFSAQEEADLVAAGRLEILPRDYEVVGSSIVFGAKPGEKFSAPLTIGQEAALVEGGHVEFVEPKQKKQAASKVEESKGE